MTRLIDQYLEIMLAKNGSDLILTAGAKPSLRLDGELQAIDDQAVTPDFAGKVVEELTNKEQWDHLHRERELDFSFGWRNQGRFRVNVFYQRGSMGLVLRLIPYRIPEMDGLGVPAAAQRLADLPRGMVLVTGPTGSGKSTTLAAMLNHINRTRGCHIVTIEDPIEYLHSHQRSVVEQRELGSDTLSFANSLRSALRENPDVVLVGEMRDLETIGVAITVAETGHLVFATLHTNDAPQTVDRIIDVFPTNQQQQVRIQLSSILQGVVSQVLLPRVGGGRVASFEVLIGTPAVRAQIRDGATHQLRNTMMTGAKDGMQVMERSLVELFRNGIIKEETMWEATLHPGEMKSFLGGPGGFAGTGTGGAEPVPGLGPGSGKPGGLPPWRR